MIRCAFFVLLGAGALLGAGVLAAGFGFGAGASVACDNRFVRVEV